MLLSGGFYGAVHMMNFYLAGVLPAAVFFPINSGCCILMAVLSARIFFHEKVGRTQAMEFAIGILAVLLLSI
jgi:drug/metabolite transporter (DMT)-like permease